MHRAGVHLDEDIKGHFLRSLGRQRQVRQVELPHLCSKIINDLFEILGIPTHDYGEEIGWEWSAVCNMRGTSWMEFELELRTLNDGTEYYIINPKVAPYAFNYPYIPPTIVSDGENDAYFVKLNREEES